LKRATISTLPKRPGLDKEEMKNYRLISNLAFISKFIETVKVIHKEEQLEKSAFNYSYQTAYRRGHLTETAPLGGHSDIPEALDEGSMTALIMKRL